MSPADVGREDRPDPVALLTAAVGSRDESAGLAPALEGAVGHLGPEGREAALVAALRAVLPVTEQWLTAHGSSPEDAASSVADVDRKLDRYGLDGTGLDWLAQVATGRVVAVGRLQFERAARLPDGARAWGVHVPETGPLDPEACDRSFAAAPAVLRQLDPEAPVDTFVCSSWLLDPEVVAVLGPSSNTARFAARFTLLPHDPGGAHAEGDDSMAKFVFGCDLTSARRAVPSGRLQRAVQERWAAGGHWSERTGTAPVGALRGEPAREPRRTVTDMSAPDRDHLDDGVDMTFEERRHDTFRRMSGSDEHDEAPRVEVEETESGDVRIDIADSAAVRPGD